MRWDFAEGLQKSHYLKHDCTVDHISVVCEIMPVKITAAFERVTRKYHRISVQLNIVPYNWKYVTFNICVVKRKATMCLFGRPFWFNFHFKLHRHIFVVHCDLFPRVGGQKQLLVILWWVGKQTYEHPHDFVRLQRPNFGDVFLCLAHRAKCVFDLRALLVAIKITP